MRSVEYLKSNGVDIDTSLNLFGDIGTYNDTLSEFITSANEKLKKLEEYKNSKDISNYRIYVHSLKSDAKYFGFTKLANVASTHEEKCSVGDMQYIIQNFSVLQSLVKDSIEIASEYLNGSDTENIVTNNKTNVRGEFKTGEIYTRPTILVVDDSNIIRNFVKKIYTDYYIGTAKDGEEALIEINTNKDSGYIKAIILDLNMPKVDGFAVLDYMRDNDLFKKMPVSIISGDSTKKTIDRAFTYDIVDMLNKPFTDSNVKSIVQKTILYKEMNN